VGDHAYQISIRIAKHEAYIHAASSKRYRIEKNHSRPQAPLPPPKRKNNHNNKRKREKKDSPQKERKKDSPKKGLK
jgi:hypothetical protein